MLMFMLGMGMSLLVGGATKRSEGTVQFISMEGMEDMGGMGGMGPWPSMEGM
eukprot:CAMPEP_0185577304 /NCGR_PEP_ID=MMETSP0434-20130131/9803_1 /TAXON_ID=626734 ORGANISM="Favella taraikaensis, Strain Fe Narragansett Bay" /NCGR_SAMPLE_ID=MMETSP0434 /ASSEMBLY_ACC=CAM_ASM_000379 /LENGTH=51 /DNA_ID=CAMNT_0028194849 /DNA_START=289 /DNA_END=444 /DNA_ORIENTATION=+